MKGAWDRGRLVFLAQLGRNMAVLPQASYLSSLSLHCFTHSFAASVNQGVEIGFAQGKPLCRWKGFRYACALSHDPFLPPSPSDPCGHVTLKRNALALQGPLPWLSGQVCTYSHAENPDGPGRLEPWGSLI